MLNVACCLIVVTALLVTTLTHAEDFGDIHVTPEAMYSGNTFHGYADMRVMLENRSTSHAHDVTLVFPNRSWSSGNCIGTLSRGVRLAPGASAMVPLLQPPLPVSGDGAIRVEVDNHDEGSVRAPNANSHMNRYGRGSTAVLFISRSLDSETVERAFKANRGAFTPAMATGAPDAGHGGYQAKAWMPDTRRHGQTNWLELDYAKPLAVDKVTVYATRGLPTSGEILLFGASGSNLVQIPMSSAISPTTRSSEREFSFPVTREPVKKIQLNFGTATTYNIGIDAVQLSGPSGNGWATDARASSDNSAQASMYLPGGSPGVNSPESLRAELPVSEWSANWLAYTPFDAVLLSASDLSAMPAPVLAAVGNYLEAGGNVFVFGAGDLPRSWNLRQKQAVNGGTEYQGGFGTCFLLTSANFSSYDPETLRDLRDKASADARYWQMLPRDNNSANAAIPVVGNLKIPVRGIVFIMLAFVIVIGPVNIIVLNRRKRRTWLLWTIPAISLFTTLLVFAYSLLSEGITPDVRIVGLTILDQVGHHATTVGATAFYCPLTPSDGLTFDSDTEVTPLLRINYAVSGSSRDVDWTQTQHLVSGWVPARVPAYFHIRKSESRRERLQLEKDHGRLEIVNGLGASIKSLWLADASGKIYEAQNVGAGQKAGLTPSAHSHVSKELGADKLFHDLGFAVNLTSLQTGGEKYLRPDTYVAELNGSPFIENALGSAASPRRTKSHAVVFGILDSSGAK